MTVVDFVAVFALGGIVTVLAVEIGRKAVRGWRYISALQRETPQDKPGLFIIPAVADGLAPAVHSRRRSKKRLPPEKRFDIFGDDEPTREIKLIRQENYR